MYAVTRAAEAAERLASVEARSLEEYEWLDSEGEMSDDMDELVPLSPDDDMSDVSDDDANDRNEAEDAAAAIPLDALDPDFLQLIGMNTYAYVSNYTFGIGGAEAMRDGVARKEVFQHFKVHGWSDVAHDAVDETVALPPPPRPYAGPCGPTDAVLDIGDNPKALFFHFLPKEMWRHIARESNKYWAQEANVTIARRLQRPRCRLTEEEVSDDVKGNTYLYMLATNVRWTDCSCRSAQDQAT